MKMIIGYLILRPLVRRNYRLRNDGILPDEWYWADILLMEWGLWGLIPPICDKHEPHA
jgi:hypothetical protein